MTDIEGVADIDGLVVGGRRMIRARYPNARTVEQMDAMQVLADVKVILAPPCIFH